MPKPAGVDNERLPVVLDPGSPGAIGWTVDALRRGGIVAFPTDTVYALAADLSQPGALNALYEVKGRSREKPIPVLLASAAKLDTVAQRVDAAVLQFVAPFWPGPLTIILPARDDMPDAVTATSTTGGRTVAVRVPNHVLALTIIEQAGGAIAATSANASGRPPASTAGEVAEQVGSRIELILDGGRTPGGVASTIVEIGPAGPVVLRQGGMLARELRRHWEELDHDLG